MLIRWWVVAVGLVLAACTGAQAGMNADVDGNAGPSYHCVGCQATCDSLVGWGMCSGCAWAKHAKREPAHLGAPSNLGPLCGACSSTHDKQQCGDLQLMLEQPMCDMQECEMAGHMYCNGCSRLLCAGCLDTMHGMSGVKEHPAHTTWSLPSVEADQAAVQGE
jgi:hypothetical protein